jgi:hypothetical protein
MYSVKSAYRVCVDIRIDRSEWKIDGEWNKHCKNIWLLIIQNLIVKIFRNV